VERSRSALSRDPRRTCRSPCEPGAPPLTSHLSIVSINPLDLGLALCGDLHKVYISQNFLALSSRQTELMIQRQRHVLAELNFLNVPAQFIAGSTFDDGSYNQQNLMKANLFMALKKCIAAAPSVTYCLIFQDDAKFHFEFWKHAAILLNSLPRHMVAVHLCPGPLSPVMPNDFETYTGPPVRGRDPRLFQLTPTILDLVKNSSGDSFFEHWPDRGGNGTRFLAGMPVVFILRRDKAKTFYNRITSRTVWYVSCCCGSLSCCSQ
jgi:hypothetical protein